jgi:hypothetical protein
MLKVVGEEIAMANVAGVVDDLINFDRATAVNISAVPGREGFYRIEAEIPHDS